MANRLFRHLSEKAPADSTNFWITTKSETDRLPRRAGFGVILHVAEFLIFSICPGLDIGMRSVRRDGWNLECDFGTGFCRDRRRYWIWRLRTGGVECVIGVAVAGAGLDGERSL